ncbi:MAG: restriction endonuclease subunit S [Desulfobacterales bacterium]|nr:restriction endonuclease subunit S [Desulfobacterales bacterium]MDD4073024.1 restriction endonuclease subunit S [Desulfobacterales bacterium]MDD4392010.1 restriction endonuclease subunit S [Desulfobacterales bacterium]
MIDKKFVTIDESSLPVNWSVVTIGDITEYIQRGKSPKYIENSGLPVINQKCIRWFGIQKEHLKYVDPDQWSKWAPERYVREGDILWNSTGTGTIGRAAVIKHLAQNEKYVVDSHVTIVRPKEVEPLYVHYWIMSQSVQGCIEAMQSGSTNQVELSKAAVEALLIPVAPPNQQKRIVAEIEKQFSRLDEAVANLKRVKANLKRYKAAVLKAAVEGKLTEEWRQAHPDVEPASKLLVRILIERRTKWEQNELANMKAKGKVPKDEQWKKKYKVPKGPERFGYKIPYSWTLATVQQVAGKVQYGSSSKTNQDNNGISVLRMGNIFEGELLLGVLKYLPEDHSEFPELLLKDNDLLFNRTNSPELVGKTAVYKGQPKLCSFASYLIRVQVLMGIESKFISYYINSMYGRKWIKSVVNQQVGQANVNGTKLQALTIPIPPSEEQRKIVLEMQNRFSLVNGLERDLDADLRRAERLRQSILKKAFSGKLVSQFPNDEPASVLLKQFEMKSETKASRSGRKPRRPKPVDYPKPGDQVLPFAAEKSEVYGKPHKP